MKKIAGLIKLLRPLQWYKNLLIFLPIVFIGQSIIYEKLVFTFIGFISLCLISSTNYIINDIIDLKKDKLHPEKKKRSLAAGKVKVWQAVLISIILGTTSFLIAWSIDILFLYAVLFLFVFTLIYSIFLKKEAFLDIIAIGINFIIRAVSGTFIIKSDISPWLILCTFFLAIYLAVGKRHADTILLGNEAKNHRATLKIYSKELTNALMIITTCLLIVFYSLYSFMSKNSYLIYTLPFALYAVFRYFQLVYSGSTIARHPERVFIDIRMVIGILIWGVATIIIIYFK